MVNTKILKVSYNFGYKVRMVGYFLKNQRKFTQRNTSHINMLRIMWMIQGFGNKGGGTTILKLRRLKSRGLSNFETKGAVPFKFKEGGRRILKIKGALAVPI